MLNISDVHDTRLAAEVIPFADWVGYKPNIPTTVGKEILGAGGCPDGGLAGELLASCIVALLRTASLVAVLHNELLPMPRAPLRGVACSRPAEKTAILESAGPTRCFLATLHGANTTENNKARTYVQQI